MCLYLFFVVSSLTQRKESSLSRLIFCSIQTIQNPWLKNLKMIWKRFYFMLGLPKLLLLLFLFLLQVSNICVSNWFTELFTMLLISLGAWLRFTSWIEGMPKGNIICWNDFWLGPVFLLVLSISICLRLWLCRVK